MFLRVKKLFDFDLTIKITQVVQSKINIVILYSNQEVKQRVVMIYLNNLLN